MNKLILPLAFLILSVSFVSALDNFDSSCQAFNFKYGIAKWYWDGQSWASDGLPSGSSVVGDSDAVTFDGGLFSEKVVVYSEDGTKVFQAGADSLTANGIYTVLFCSEYDGAHSTSTSSSDGPAFQILGDPEVPEFGVVAATIAFVGAIGVFMAFRKK